MEAAADDMAMRPSGLEPTIALGGGGADPYEFTNTGFSLDQHPSAYMRQHKKPSAWEGGTKDIDEY